MGTAVRSNLRELTHVFIITTNPDKLRDKLHIEWFEGVPVKYISEFDFRNKSEEELNLLYNFKAFLQRYGSAPSAGAIGCATAHRECYRILSEEGGCCALIFEDDVLYDHRLIETIHEINSSLLDYDVVNLSIIQGVFYSKPVIKLKNGLVYRASLSQFGAYAYLIHRECAKQFYDIQRPLIRNYADWPLETWKFKCFGVHASLTQFSGRPTTVQSSRTAHRHTLITKCIHFFRVIYWRMVKFYCINIRKDIIVE